VKLSPVEQAQLLFCSDSINHTLAHRPCSVRWQCGWR